MEIRASRRGNLSEMLNEMGICGEEVLLFRKGKLIPETTNVEKGDRIKVVKIKHGWIGSPQGRKAPKAACSCGKKAVVFLPEKGRHYCAGHFPEYFEKN